MKNIIRLFVVLLLLSGCALNKQQRTENKVARKIEKLQRKYPAAFDSVTIKMVRIDTVIKEVRIAGESRLDTIRVTEFLTEFLHDSIDRVQFITRFVEVARDTIEVDTLGIHLNLQGVGMKYSLVKDEQRISLEESVETITITKTEVVRKIPWWIYLIIGTLGGLLAVSIIKK